MRGSEALHLSLTASDAQIRILRAIVFSRTSRPVSIAGTRGLKRCSGIAPLLDDQAHHRCYQVERVQAVSTCMRSSQQIRIQDEIRRGNPMPNCV